MSARESGIGDARRGPATASADASRRDRLASLESAGLDRCRQCRGADAQTAADGAAARSRLLMIGTSPETLGGIAAVVDVYRQAGLFEQWPIRYIATHRDGGALRKCAVAVSAIATFLAELVRDRNAVIHVHCASHASFWHDNGDPCFELDQLANQIETQIADFFKKYSTIDSTPTEIRAVFGYFNLALSIAQSDALWKLLEKVRETRRRKADPNLSRLEQLYCREGNKIRAIKEYRERTGASLKESKEIVEAWMRDNDMGDRSLI